MIHNFFGASVSIVVIKFTRYIQSFFSVEGTGREKVVKFIMKLKKKSIWGNFTSNASEAFKFLNRFFLVFVHFLFLRAE